MHSVFLYHAIRAGLDMAIVNAAQLPLYEEIDPELLRAVEDVILCRDEGPPNVFWSWPRIKDRTERKDKTSHYMPKRRGVAGVWKKATVVRPCYTASPPI